MRNTDASHRLQSARGMNLTEEVARGGPAGHDEPPLIPRTLIPDSFIDRVKRLLVYMEQFNDQTCRLMAMGLIASEAPTESVLEAALIASQSIPEGSRAMYLYNAFHEMGDGKDIHYKLNLADQLISLLPNLSYPRAVIVAAPLIEMPAKNSNAIVVNDATIENSTHTNPEALFVNRGIVNGNGVEAKLIIALKDISLCLREPGMVIAYDCSIIIDDFLPPSGQLFVRDIQIVSMGDCSVRISENYRAKCNRCPNAPAVIEGIVHPEIHPAIGSPLYQYLTKMRSAVEGTAEDCTAYLREQGSAHRIRKKINALWRKERGD